jgi:hypothetical protein
MHRSSTVARRAVSKLPALVQLPLAALGFMLMALTLLALAGLSGCESAPVPPAWDNPFDPTGPDDGDPLHLNILAVGGTINLTWDQPQGRGIAEYAISHTVHPDSAWTSVTRVAHTTGINNFYPYENATPTQSHWFRVQAMDEDGNAQLVDYATTTGTLLGPRVIINQDGSTVASRLLAVKVIVSRGTSLRVALGPAFSPEVTFPAAAAGDTAVLSLDAGAFAQGDTVRVRVRSVDGAYSSVATIATAKVDFSPDFAIAGGGTIVASRTVTLSIPAAGIDQMRFANSEAGLAAASWTPGAGTHTELLLGAGETAQQIWGEFSGDFGFNSVSHLTVTPDLLTGAAFRLEVPANRQTTTRDIRGILTGKATQVRWSESPDLAAAPWQAHADTLDITLSEGAGTKTIYLQMRNDWRVSALLSDYAIFVSTGADPAR